METEKNKQPKTSLVKQAAWLAVLDAACIISTLILIIKNQITFTAEDYAAPIPTPMLLSLVSLFLLVGLFLVSIQQTKNREHEDELSTLNRYKAGHLAKYICVIAIAAIIWLIQDFRFAFCGDFLDNLRLPFIFIIFSQLVENIAFIILEKTNLE